MANVIDGDLLLHSQVRKAGLAPALPTN